VRRDVANLLYLFILFTKIKKICNRLIEVGTGQQNNDKEEDRIHEAAGLGGATFAGMLTRGSGGDSHWVVR
jgi:hypothetical protein